MTPEKLIARVSALLQSGAASEAGGLIIVRLDRAAQLRDRFGLSGLLKLTAQLMRRFKDGTDTDLVVVRLDPATLIVLAAQAGVDQLDRLSRREFADLSETPFKIDCQSVAVTASMVTCAFSYRFTDADEMLVAMLRRIEEIAAAGGNELGQVKPRMLASRALNSSQHMLGLLMESLQKDAVKVVFQPLMATGKDAAWSNYQMLPRLCTSDGKLIAAAEFLPLAREASLIPVLDRWMLVHAIRLFQGALKGQHVRLFINQSDALLAEPERLDWLIRQLEKAPQTSRRLVIELRLDDAMSHLDRARALLESAREVGLEVCLTMVDEHSRWDLLEDGLGSDYIRMSPDFVARLTHERALEKRFAEITARVRKAGTRIIVPMVEDSETAASMWRSGVDFMQGNMIQAPEEAIQASG
ncbi:MAG: EAL domain-containing protein [Pseudomonadota bacterium]|nr:MAG: EAL domain-containing protein [Pseudomonadota bacterium]